MKAAGLLAVAVLPVVLCPESSFAQDAACVNPEKTLVGEFYEVPTPCAGAYKARWEAWWTVGTVTACEVGGWMSQNGPSTDLRANVDIDCGPSSDEPVCPPPSNIAPAFRGWANGTAFFVLTLSDIVYFDNLTCEAGTTYEYEAEVPAEGCRGAFCCGLAEQCAASGKEFYPDSCWCTTAPPPPPPGCEWQTCSEQVCELREACVCTDWSVEEDACTGEWDCHPYWDCHEEPYPCCL